MSRTYLVLSDKFHLTLRIPKVECMLTDVHCLVLAILLGIVKAIGMPSLSSAEICQTLHGITFFIGNIV